MRNSSQLTGYYGNIILCTLKKVSITLFFRLNLILAASPHRPSNHFSVFFQSVNIYAIYVQY